MGSVELTYGRLTDPPLIGRLAALRRGYSDRTSRQNDHPDTAYAFHVLRFETDQVDYPRLMNGVRLADRKCAALYDHLRRVSRGAVRLAYDFGLGLLAEDVEVAGDLHDASKPIRPDIFFTNKKREEMTMEERAVLDGHAIDCAEIARRAGNETAARLIVTMHMLSRRPVQHQLQDIQPFAEESNEHRAAQALEAYDQGVGMIETGPHRPYRRHPLSLEEVERLLPKQVSATPEVIARVMHYLSRYGVSL